MTRKAELALVLSAGLISQQDADRIQRSALALKIQDIQEEKAAEQKRQVGNICRLNPRERHSAEQRRCGLIAARVNGQVIP